MVTYLVARGNSQGIVKMLRIEKTDAAKQHIIILNIEKIENMLWAQRLGKARQPYR